jgi:hypothetical protein
MEKTISEDVPKLHRFIRVAKLRKKPTQLIKNLCIQPVILRKPGPLPQIPFEQWECRHGDHKASIRARIKASQHPNEPAVKILALR